MKRDLESDRTIKEDLSCESAKNAFAADRFPQKRTRTVMTPNQYKMLKNVLAKTAFPSTELREQLASVLDMKPRTIQIWFQNQRQKAKFKKIKSQAADMGLNSAISRNQPAHSPSLAISKDHVAMDLHHTYSALGENVQVNQLRKIALSKDILTVLPSPKAPIHIPSLSVLAEAALSPNSLAAIPYENEKSIELPPIVHAMKPEIIKLPSLDALDLKDKSGFSPPILYLEANSYGTRPC